jgi:hypothetical protein
MPVTPGSVYLQVADSIAIRVDSEAPYPTPHQRDTKLWLVHQRHHLL